MGEWAIVQKMEALGASQLQIRLFPVIAQGSAMAKIPILNDPETDELFASWAIRLARENGFSDTKSFFNAYVYPNDEISSSYSMKVDFRVPFEHFWRALPHDSVNERTLFFNTSTFTGVAPLFTREQRQRYINQAFNLNREYELLFPLPHGSIVSLFICPECAANEIRRNGSFYLHRAHHMPGVQVCHLHGCALGRISTAYLHLTDEIIPSYVLEKVDQPDFARDYAVFAKDFLDEAFDCSISDFIHLIKQKAKRGSNEELSLSNELIENKELLGIWNRKPMSISPGKGLLALYHTFRTIENLKKGISTIQQEEAIDVSSSGEYTLMGDYRNDLIMIRHNLCGETFCTSPYGFEIGWRCPKCDRGLSLQEKYCSLVDAVGKGDYKPSCVFAGMDKRAELLHLECGNTFSVKPRAFFYEGVRCKCKRRVTYEKVKQAVERHDGFSLIDYVTTDRPITVKHSCGGSFIASLSKFTERPYCRLCQRREHLTVRTTEDFEQDLKDLVGDEYSLVGDYNGPHSYLEVRHNTCGRIQKYRPYYFLDGGRCKYCHMELTHGEFTSFVNKYSAGQYSVLGKATKNLYEVVDNRTGKTVKLSKLRILQELRRPTPSVVLPIDNPNLNVEFCGKRISDTVLSWIRSRYAIEPIFLEDIQIDGLSNEQKQCGIQSLVKAKKLVHLSTGIYGFPEYEYLPVKIIEAKYLCRRGKHIGFYRGSYLAYILGLRDDEPELSIATNKESKNTSARKIDCFGTPIHIRGHQETIDNSNYLVFEILDFLIQYKQCTKKELNEVLASVREYIMKKNNGSMLQFHNFEPYIEKHKSNIKTHMQKLLLDLCGKDPLSCE